VVQGKQDGAAKEVDETAVAPVQTIDVPEVTVVGPTETPPVRKRGRPSTVSLSTPQPATATPKSVKMRVADAKPFVEVLGIDVPSNRRLLAFNRLDRQALAFGSTVRQKARTEKVRQSNFCCALCPFISDSRDLFQSHILVHKPVVVRGVLSQKPLSVDAAGNDPVSADCLQCKECGMCFATEPSWRKHLFLLHRIKNPNPDDQCADLRTSGLPATRLVQIAFFGGGGPFKSPR
jgi:hypothetical protein